MCWNILFWMNYFTLNYMNQYLMAFLLLFQLLFRSFVLKRDRLIKLANAYVKRTFIIYKLVFYLVRFVFLTFFTSNIFVEAVATIVNPFAFSVLSWCFTITWAVFYTICFTFIFPEIVCPIYEHRWYFSAALCTLT